MQLPSPQVDIEFAQFLQALPADWEAMMREQRAFRYAGKILTPAELLRAIFLYCGPDQSLREVAGILTLRAERITDQAVWKRLHRCTPFLIALLKQLLPLTELPALPAHLRFLACDGTTLECPGATGTDYRLHLVINLSTLSFQEVQISDVKKGESLKHYRLHPGDVMVADRGYCSYSGILHTVCDRGAEVIVRWNHQRQLYAPQEKSRAIDFCAALKRQKPGTMGSLPVVLKYAETSKQKDTRELCGSLHVYRMTAKEAKEAGQRVSRMHQKKQRKLSEKTRFLRQFVLVFTSLSSEVLAGEVVLDLYRCRWQIELAIKRMKSLININKLRAQRGSKLAEVYLYGKVLYLLLVEHDMRTTFDQEWSGLDGERQGTGWRLYKLLKARFDALLIAQWAWRDEAVPACFHVLMERPRKRKLQRLPHRVVELRYTLTTLAHAA
jgi:Transposase DDE domain